MSKQDIINESLSAIKIFAAQINGKQLPNYETSLIRNGKLETESAEFLINLKVEGIRQALKDLGIFIR